MLPGITGPGPSPRSPTHIGQARYSATYVGGTGPIQTDLVFPTPVRELYICYWLQHSSNWDGHASGVNKVLHLWIAGGNRAYLNAHGVNAGSLMARVHFQGMGVPVPALSWNGTPNRGPMGAADLTRGTWHRWEVLLKGNTPGQLDGEAHWWVDGVQVGSYTNVGYVSASENNRWTTISWNPTWGGGGDQLTAAQFLWVDHLYASGR